MAIERIKLNTLGAIEEDPIEYMNIGNTVVTVHKYIPYEQMLDMIQWCIDYIINDRPFISAPLKRIIKDFAILNFYTNFDFAFLTEYHEMADIYAEYDLVYRFDVIAKVKEFIDPGQMDFFENTLDETLESIMKYRNSAVGIVDAIAENAKQDTDNIQRALDFMNDKESGEQLDKMISFAQQIKGNK